MNYYKSKELLCRFHVLRYRTKQTLLKLPDYWTRVRKTSFRDLSYKYWPASCGKHHRSFIHPITPWHQSSYARASIRDGGKSNTEYICRSRWFMWYRRCRLVLRTRTRPIIFVLSKLGIIVLMLQKNLCLVRMTHARCTRCTRGAESFCSQMREVIFVCFSGLRRRVFKCRGSFG